MLSYIENIKIIRKLFFRDRLGSLRDLLVLKVINFSIIGVN